jgi:RNA polymerase sigma-70 factor (ECF subfamily)
MTPRRSHAPLSLVVGQDHRAASDADVARGLGAREDWALAEAWERFAPMVLTTARRLLGSKAESEDIAQDVFYRVFLKAHTLRDPDRLRSFVFSVAMRALTSELRRRKRRSWFHSDDGEALGDLGCEIESRDLLLRFRALLARLPARESQVFVLKRMEAMTVEEIALVMETSVSTVKRLLARASDQLARAINADPGLAALLARERWGK